MYANVVDVSAEEISPLNRDAGVELYSRQYIRDTFWDTGSDILARWATHQGDGWYVLQRDDGTLRWMERSGATVSEFATSSAPAGWGSSVVFGETEVPSTVVIRGSGRSLKYVHRVGVNGYEVRTVTPSGVSSSKLLSADSGGPPHPDLAVTLDPHRPGDGYYVQFNGLLARYSWSDDPIGSSVVLPPQLAGSPVRRRAIVSDGVVFMAGYPLTGREVEVPQGGTRWSWDDTFAWHRGGTLEADGVATDPRLEQTWAVDADFVPRGGPPSMFTGFTPVTVS